MTQTEQIAAHLDKAGEITALDALSLYGVFRLAARIEELRRAGQKIRTEIQTTRTGKRIARYVRA